MQIPKCVLRGSYKMQDSPFLFFKLRVLVMLYVASKMGAASFVLLLLHVRSYFYRPKDAAGAVLVGYSNVVSCFDKSFFSHNIRKVINSLQHWPGHYNFVTG